MGARTSYSEIGAAVEYQRNIGDGTNQRAGGWGYDAAAGEMYFRAANGRRGYFTSTGLVVNGDISQPSANAVHTIGDAAAPGSPSTHVEVDAVGTYRHRVDNGTNNFHGGWLYDAQFNTFGVRVNNADQVYVQDGSFYPTLDGDVSNGLTTRRWLDFYSDAATVGGDFDQDVASLTNTHGSGGGTVDVYLLSDATAGQGRVFWNKTSTTQTTGDFLDAHGADEVLRRYYYDGTAVRVLAKYTDDQNITFMEGAQADGTITIGPGATYTIDLVGGYDLGLNIGTDAIRIGDLFYHVANFGYVADNTNYAFGRDAAFLEANSATQVITLPDAGTAGEGTIYYIDCQTTHTSGSLKNSAGDTINDNDKSSTGFPLSVGLWMAVSDGVTNWELFGPVTRPDTTT